jgi:hypothetical protein
LDERVQEGSVQLVKLVKHDGLFQVVPVTLDSAAKVLVLQCIICNFRRFPEKNILPMHLHCTGFFRAAV